MRTLNNHALLGLFIVIGAGLFVLAILTVGSRQKTFSRTARVRIVFDDAGGLQPGCNVWLSGVKVGTVKRLSLDADNRVEVQLSIGRTEFSHLYRDASGKIGLDGLIGNRIITLNGGTPSSGTLSENAVIQSQRSLQTEEILTTLQENNKNLLYITAQLRTIADKINNGKGTIGLLLNDQGMAGRLRKAVSGLQLASDNMIELTGRLNTIAGKLDSGPGLVHQLTTDTSVFRQLQETLTQLQIAGTKITTASANIDLGSRALNNPNTPAGVLLTDPTVAADLKATVSHLRTSSEKLDEDLLALQHSFLLRGFFRKKEKARKDSLKTSRSF